MINPGGIPQIPGDMDALAQHASDLTAVGGDFATTGQQVNTTWQGLAGVYQAPEVGELLAATAPVQSVSASVGADIKSVGSALTTYAAEVKQIKARLAQLKTEAEGFVNSVKDDDDWQKDQGKVDKNNNLVNAVSDEMAKFFDAQRRCANAINALYGGTQYTAVSGDQPKDGEYGYTADQLKAATKAGAELPWGKAEEHDGGFWGGVGSFFAGIGEGFMDMVKGLGGLIGWGEDGWSWSNAGHAWAGLGKFALALGVYGIPVVGPALDQTIGVPGFKRGEMGDTLLTAGKGIIAWDDWSKDPARAGGKATFNIVTAIVGTKGAGAAMRGVGAAAEGSRIAAVARTGTLMVRAGEAIGKLPTVSDLAISAGRKFAGLFDGIKGALHFDAPKVDVPHVNEPTPHPHPTDHTPQPHPGSVGDNLGRETPIPDREPAHVGAGHGHDTTPSPHDGSSGGDHGSSGHDGSGGSGDHGGSGHDGDGSGNDHGGSDHNSNGNNDSGNGNGGGDDGNAKPHGGDKDGHVPQPAMDTTQKAALDQHQNQLAQQHPQDYEYFRDNDPAHQGKQGKRGQEIEAKIALDLREQQRLPADLERPTKAEDGDFISPSTGKKYDVKGFYSDWPDHVPPQARNRPFPEAITPQKFEDAVGKELQLLPGEKYGDRNVIINTRNLDQHAIDFMKQIVEDKGWGDRIVWYP